VPVFLLVIFFNIKSITILNWMSAFSAGALIGDVFFHNLPEIFDGKRTKASFNTFFHKKETFLGLGLISLFVIEKVIKLLYSLSRKKEAHGNYLNPVRLSIGFK